MTHKYEIPPGQGISNGPPLAGPRGQGRRRSVDLWFFRPIEDVALRFTTGHGVPFHWVRDTQRDVVNPREFAEWHLEGTWVGALAGHSPFWNA